MKCINCGNEMQITGDDYYHGICALCKANPIGQSYPLEDKIIKILRNNETCPFVGHKFLSAIESANYRKIAKEIIALEKDLKQSPEFDKDYLNECIEKATPNLSKIKDVDKELAEIRGEKEKPLSASNSPINNPDFFETQIIDVYEKYDISPMKDELTHYKIWENIFGDNYDTIESMIDGYIEYLKSDQ